MSNDTSNPFDKSLDTQTRLKPLNDSGLVIVVTQAFGPNGESLIDHDGPRFSGEPGVKVRVKQGDLVEDVVLSPFYGDSSKVSTLPFKEGVPCELSVPSSGAPLDVIPGMRTEEGGDFFAIYLTPRLKNGELVAINNIWGNYHSQMLDERGLLELYADLETDE